MKTLIVTDNPRQAQFVQKGFRYENIPSDIWSLSNPESLEALLPFYDGFFLLFHESALFQEYGALCRAVCPHVPLFFLMQSENQRIYSSVKELSVNCCASRPFSFRSIAAEMRVAIFQVKESVENPRLAVRDLELDIVGHRFLCCGKEVLLRNKEFALLQFFMAHSGTVLSRTELLENVWDRNASILTNTVDVHISQLRKKISQFTDDIYIRTVPCRGYIFV